MKVLAWIAAALLVGTAQATPGAQALFADCPAGLPARDVRDRPISPSFWQGGPVLAVFWSTDCAFCQRHNERLDRLLRAEPGAAVIAIAVDDQADAVRRIVERRGYGFPVILDFCGLRAQLTPRKVVPMTCWLGEPPKGPRCIPGEMADDDLRELLKRSRAR
ncbi:TlpA family protein disulfide reductase [Roseateles sp.]|uniref:TlpA family protein disulfide reductase n=1 Tax=Roseateles sp. TaxID=1971397 RepID=UPI003BA9324C